MIIKDAADRFAIYLTAAGRSAKTIRSYNERLKRFLRFSGKVKVEDVTADDLDDYVVDLRRSLSASSVAGYIQAVKTFFRWCVQRGYVKVSPAAHLRKPKIDHNARNKAIDDEDFRAMLNAARAEGRKMETAILLLLMDTGCRAGKLCSLNVEDIDLEALEAKACGKSGSRMLDFTRITANALRDWMDERNCRIGALFVYGDKRLTIYGLYSRLQGLAKRAGVHGRFNPQSFRHRVGQGWIDRGANLEIVRLKLGHKDIHTTSLFYANQDRERQKRASERYSLVK